MELRWVSLDDRDRSCNQMAQHLSTDFSIQKVFLSLKSAIFNAHMNIIEYIYSSY